MSLEPLLATNSQSYIHQGIVCILIISFICLYYYVKYIVELGTYYIMYSVVWCYLPKEEG